jgi:hypothetical protein
MSDAQRKAARNIDLATDTVLAYAAPTVPPLGNLTPEGLVEDLGRLNNARKLFEKTEKILKERLKSQLPPGCKELRSDNFTMKYEDRPRTALSQTKAKAYLEEQGILPDFMETTAVPTMTISENG